MRSHRWIGIALVGACLCAQAQWNVPQPNAPRTPDGKVDLTAPAPRVNGKPDLSGIWQAEAEPRGPALFGLGESPNSKYFRDILSDFKPGEEPLTPAGIALLRQHSQPGAFNPSLNCLPDGVPHADLLPEPFKIIQIPGEILILYEVETIFRQVFTDGRPLPKLSEVEPTWLGYSVGRWEGDTFVVESTGFRDLGWLSAERAYPNSDALHVIERFKRTSIGHMDLIVTIDDPKAFVKPWTNTIPLTFLPDSELIEAFCDNQMLRLQHWDIPAMPPEPPSPPLPEKK